MCLFYLQWNMRAFKYVSNTGILNIYKRNYLLQIWKKKELMKGAVEWRVIHIATNHMSTTWPLLPVHCQVYSVPSDTLSNNTVRYWHWQNHFLLTRKLQIFNPSCWRADNRVGLFTSMLCRDQSPICGCRSFINTCNLMRYTLSCRSCYVLAWSKAV